MIEGPTGTNCSKYKLEKVDVQQRVSPIFGRGWGVGLGVKEGAMVDEGMSW